MVDLEQLQKDIENLTRRQKLYQVLKVGLTKKGYWKAKARGNPKLGYAIAKSHKKRG